MMKWVIISGAVLLGGCTSHIVPLRPAERVEVWVDDTPATEPGAQMAPAAEAAARSSETLPATTPATQVATTQPATQPATRPGHMAEKMVDPNETSRYIYDANYDNVWRQATSVLAAAGFVLDQQDYRLGVLTTKPLPSAQVIEFWKPQQSSINNALENTINNQQRYIRLTISKVEGKPEFYKIGIQVLVERETNPSEQIGGPIFVEGSGFGRNAITLQSDYAAAKPPEGRWVIVGHDPDLETKLLDQLFKRI